MKNDGFDQRRLVFTFSEKIPRRNFSTSWEIARKLSLPSAYCICEYVCAKFVGERRAQWRTDEKPISFSALGGRGKRCEGGVRAINLCLGKHEKLHVFDNVSTILIRK